MDIIHNRVGLIFLFSRKFWIYRNVIRKAFTPGTTVISGETGIQGNFGVSITVADYNGDGFSDVVIELTMMLHRSREELIFFILPGKSGVTINSASSATTILTGESGMTSSFSSYCVSLDGNLDGYDDLFQELGRPSNKIYYFQSSSSGIATGFVNNLGIVITGENSSDQFGRFLATGDFNGDGFSDIAVTGLAFNSSTGKSYILQKQ